MLIAAANPPKIAIGTEIFAQADILDGRATADAGGKPAVMLTFKPAAAARLAAIADANDGKPVAVRVGDAEVAKPIVRPSVVPGVFEISGLASFADAAALAKRISGKEPLPETTDE